ncbi:MAG: hypothetical protein LBR33_09505 [Propionibacteriaceae bacterium]|nr:hypothetical protein [Propionibacteriaceae bacterium]
MTVTSTDPTTGWPVPDPADEVRIHYNPMPAAERVAHYTGLVRTRLLWLGVAAAICLGFWFISRAQLDRATTIALFAAGVGYSVVWLVMAVVGLVRSRRILRSIGQGIAVRIGRWGIDIHGAAVPWTAVTAVRARRHRFSGYGPDLAVETTAGTKSLPWLFLDTLPGTVDAAVQAYTAGARRLDISRLDH